MRLQRRTTAGALACEALGGPCDGRMWLLPGPPAPIWLDGRDGHRHLYRPIAGAGGPFLRYRYSGQSSPVRGWRIPRR